MCIRDRDICFDLCPNIECMQSDIAIFGEWAHAATIMLMIQNNLDPGVAQYLQELITYDGNGALFQNWAQRKNMPIFP